MTTGVEKPELIRSFALDASALVKYVVPEPGSDAVELLVSSYALVYTSFISLVEALGVLKRKWLKKELDRQAYEDAGFLLVTYTREGGSIILEDEPIHDFQVLHDAELLARAHRLDLADGLQLYSLKHGKQSHGAGECQTVMVTADRDLAKAARAEGLKVWDCEHEPLPEHLRDLNA